MQKKFKKQIDSLQDVFDFIQSFNLKWELDNVVMYAINLVAEELFTNMVKYNLDSQNDILISLEKQGNELFMQLIDFDVQPFDITRTESVNTDKKIEQRKVGGLGLHLIKQYVDDINYTHENGNNIITIIKRLESKYV